jgi:hypothetical protein
LANPAVSNPRAQVEIAVRNTGAKPCALQGAPVLTYLNVQTDQQILGTEHQIGPSSHAPPNPVVILAPHHPPIPAGITNPTDLPAGTGWFSVTANPVGTKCAATTTRNVLFTLPFDATMPVHFNVIPTATAVANPPVPIDNCGTLFTNPFHAP